MAPAGTLGKRKPHENRFIFDLGVKGRKTGLTLPDTGIRDENGLEPMEHLFSSPEKPSATRQKVNGSRKNANSTISSEEDMDVGESTIPEPTAVISERKRLRLPPPRSKSPIKTFLQSPARRNPSLGPVSSPARGSIVAPRPVPVPSSVRRKLYFSTDDSDGNTLESSTKTGSSQKWAGSSSTKATSAELPNGTKQGQLQRAFSPEFIPEVDQDSTSLEDGGDSLQMVDIGDVGEVSEEDDEVEQPEPEPEPEPQILKKGKARSKAKPSEPEPEPVSASESEAAANIVERARGKAKRQSNQPIQQEADEPPAKRARHSLEGPHSLPKPAAKGKSRKPSKTTVAAGKIPKLAAIAEGESPEIQRGPPMPRTNRGLFILRRETPMEGNGFKRTRSGRTSVKPVAWWKNERIEYSDDEAEDQSGKFLLSRIKEVVRRDEVEDERPKSKQYKSKKSTKRTTVVESEEDDEIEAWEVEPGRIIGEIRTWDPEEQIGVEVMEEEEIALSSAAIVTREVDGASFRFAKTLKLPFFGSGMVDLPVGAVKKPKPSGKMQMVFFVFYGRVQVTVNDTIFRIGKGGMWQVPRGNFYSIENDYDEPARIFFSQGCEV